MADYRNEPEKHALQVNVRYNGDSREDREKALEKALSQFKKMIMKEGLMNELKERQYYTSPGRKRYLQRQKFYHRLNQKKEKDALGFKKKAMWDDKKQHYNNSGKTNYGRPNQPNRPNAPQHRPIRQAVHTPVHR